MDYQTQRREAFKKIGEQRAEGRQKLLEVLDPILQNYVKEDNISLVIDKKIVIAGSNNEYNITNIIIEKLNKSLPSLNLK